MAAYDNLLFTVDYVTILPGTDNNILISANVDFVEVLPGT
jgi:glycerol-3-phosphate responsive antiterminator